MRAPRQWQPKRVDGRSQDSGRTVTPAPGGTVQRQVDSSPRQRASGERLAGLRGHNGADTLPAPLRQGMEALGGVDMSDVRVHRNSPKPAQLQARAYAQGPDIYLGAGEDRHLPHEAWHVVQQKQGRVRPTVQRKAGVGINDDPVLEREADVMGSRVAALQLREQGARGAARAEQPDGALPFVVQLEDLPSDSTGSLDDMHFRADDQPITGTHLQQALVQELTGMIKEEKEVEFGYRLCTYQMLDRRLENIKINGKLGVEGHGMPPFPVKIKDGSPVSQKILPLVLGTLIAAKQMDYIEKNWEKISATHEVLIDVDWYLRRGPDDIGFHKDSRGTTLFVNLTYNNDSPIQGAEKYEDLHGLPFLESKLPDEVRSDLGKRRAAATDPQTIDGPILPAHGRISFTDPSVWHATPMMDHRLKYGAVPRPKNKADTLAMLFRLNIPDGEAKQFFARYEEQSVIDHLYKKHIKDTEGEFYDNHDVSAENPELKIDPVHRAKLSRDLRRRARAVSMNLDDVETQRKIAAQIGKPRGFIRTWVRLVPRTT